MPIREPVKINAPYVPDCEPEIGDAYKKCIALGSEFCRTRCVAEADA